MKSKFKILLSLIVCSLLCVIGCEKVDIESHTQALKAEIAEVKSLMVDAQIQRDEFTAKLEQLSKVVSATQAQIEELKQNADSTHQAQLKLEEISQQRDQAIASSKEAQAMTKQLQAQLNELTQKVTSLQTMNKGLQESITKSEPEPEAEGSVDVKEIAKVGFPDFPVYK